MDARALAEAVGIEITTLNLWVQRDLVPGLKIGSQGRKRVIGATAALSVYLVAEMARFGVSTPMAAQIAADIHQHKAKLLLITRLPAPSNTERFRASYCQDEAEIPQRLAELRAIAEREGEPGAAMYAVLDVEILRARLEAAQRTWAQAQQQQQAA